MGGGILCGSFLVAAHVDRAVLLKNGHRLWIFLNLYEWGSPILIAGALGCSDALYTKIPRIGGGYTLIFTYSSSSSSS